MKITSTPNRADVTGTPVEKSGADPSKAVDTKKIASPASGHLDTAFHAWKQHRPVADAPAGRRADAFSVSSFAQMAKLGQEFPHTDATQSVFRQLDGILAKCNNLSLPPEMEARGALDLMGAAKQVESLLHQVLSAAVGQGAMQQLAESVGQVIQLVASMLAGLQGRPGQPPLGYSPGAFAPANAAPPTIRPQVLPGTQWKPPAPPVATPQTGSAGEAGQQQRAAEAKQILNDGALGAGETPKPKEPVVTEAEKKAYDAAIARADDDASVRLSRDPKAMAAASPEQKAKLIRELMDGHTTDEEDCAIVKILESCTSKAEYDKVLAAAGGKNKVFKELDDDGAKGRFSSLEKKWNTQQKAAVDRVLILLEQCDDPEEAKRLAAELGGIQLKHQMQDKEQLRRLEALATRYNMPALGYGLPPEVVLQKREAIRKAVVDEDSDLATALAEDRDAMKVASPSEKSGLIRELQDGWTKDRQDVAVYKILSSSTSKAEFDEVMQSAGGREVLGDMDDDETRAKMNELFGSWGRVDLADDKVRAEKFRDVMADPQKQAALAATRPPTASEISQVGGNFKVDPADAADPLMQHAGQAMGAVRQNVQKKAFDVDWDPQAKTELVLEQRRREIDGKPRLDFTKLTVEADKITSDPDFNKKVEEFRKEFNKNGLVKLDEKEAREKYVTSQMDNLRKQYGLSEQTMKALVTQRMGQINTEGGVEMNAHRSAVLGPLMTQLSEIEKSKGPNSAEAVELRERIAKFDRVTGEYANHLSSVGEIQKKMFPVPASFMEGFVKAFSFIADIAAAVVSCIPGVGQALGAVYFGVKAIVAAAKGDVLGVFSSIASAIPGVGGAIGGAAGSALKTAGRMAQTAIGVASGIAEGNVLGALGSAAGLGSGVAPLLDFAQKGLKLADGISRGDISAIAGAAGGILGPLSNNPAVQGIVNNPVVKGIAEQTQNALPFIEGLASGDVGRALGGLASGLGPLASGSPEARQALDFVNDGARFAEALRSGDYGRAIAGLGTGFERMGSSPEAAALIGSFGQVSNLIGALGTGDPAQLANALRGQDGRPGFLQEIGGGGLSKAFAGVSNLAGQMLGSPQFLEAMDLTRVGTRFFGALGSGALHKALDGAAGMNESLAGSVQNLSGVLASARPLVQSMARGDFQSALEELRGNTLTAGTADRLGVLEPLADLAQGDWLKSLESTEANLGQLAGIDRQLHHFQDLERSIQQLQQRFGQVDEMSRHLLDRSGFRAPAAAGNAAAD
jgi:hypothetical protein